MSVRHLSELTWPEVAALVGEHGARVVAILPIGAVEAHGPHLPLQTDRVIAQAMAEDGGARLAAHGLQPLVLPPLDWTPAPFAASFAGTVSIRPATLRALLVDLAASVAGWGVEALAIANAHFDPANLGAIADAVASIADAGRPRVIFPDLTRKPWALRLGDEFLSGACHAGRYEGSVVMARAPQLVREALRRALAPNPASLSVAIRGGQRDFVEAGGPQAYFGDPAAASAEEGAATVATLGAILCQAVLADRASAAG